MYIRCILLFYILCSYPIFSSSKYKLNEISECNSDATNNDAVDALLYYCAGDRSTNTDSSFSYAYIFILADELTRVQTRAAIQTEERNACHEVRSCSRLIVLHSFSSTQTDTSIIPMEDHHYSKILDSALVFFGNAASKHCRKAGHCQFKI